MANASNFNLTDISDAFKERFVGKMVDQYNNSTPLISKIKKSFNFLGKKDYRSVGLSAGVGRGAGSLPTASHDSASYDQAEITAKKLYVVVEVDRESMKAGKNSEGIFDVSSLEHVAKRAVQGMNLSLQRILYGDASGSLYTGNASNSNVTGAGTAGDPYDVLMDGDATSIVFANFEEGDLVNINSETDNLSVQKVTKTAGSEQLELVGTSTRLAALAGSGPFTTTDNIYLQGSKDNEPEGLDMVGNTSGTSYNVSHTARRWQGVSIAAGGAAISEDLLNQLVLDIEEQSGKTPDIITASYYQFRKIKDFMSDHKRIEINPRDEKLVGKVSFSALQFMSASGPIPIVADRFVGKDVVYAINTDHIEMLHRPDWGWFDEDGTIFLRRDTSDNYQARYGGYMQVFIEPAFHGRLTGLADS
jgi:hypothetical protein